VLIKVHVRVHVQGETGCPTLKLTRELQGKPPIPEKGCRSRWVGKVVDGEVVVFIELRARGAGSPV